MNEEAVPFEELIGFVAGQPEAEGFGQSFNGRSHTDFAIVLEGECVRPGKFTESHQAVSASEELGKKEQVVMVGCGPIGTKDMQEVGFGEG